MIGPSARGFMSLRQPGKQVQRFVELNFSDFPILASGGRR
jgi:hypothetical protein